MDTNRRREKKSQYGTVVCLDVVAATELQWQKFEMESVSWKQEVCSADKNHTSTLCVSHLLTRCGCSSERNVSLCQCNKVTTEADLNVRNNREGARLAGRFACMPVRRVSSAAMPLSLSASKCSFWTHTHSRQSRGRSAQFLVILKFRRAKSS